MVLGVEAMVGVVQQMLRLASATPPLVLLPGGVHASMPSAGAPPAVRHVGKRERQRPQPKNMSRRGTIGLSIVLEMAGRTIIIISIIGICAHGRA